MNQETLFKRDKTRLTNLLKNYRDHMITTHMEKCPYKDITKVIDLIDYSIGLITFSM